MNIGCSLVAHANHCVDGSHQSAILPSARRSLLVRAQVCGPLAVRGGVARIRFGGGGAAHRLAQWRAGRLVDDWDDERERRILDSARRRARAQPDRLEPRRTHALVGSGATGAPAAAMRCVGCDARESDCVFGMRAARRRLRRFLGGDGTLRPTRHASFVTQWWWHFIADVSLWCW